MLQAGATPRTLHFHAPYGIADLWPSPAQRWASSWTTGRDRDGASPVSVPTWMNPMIVRADTQSPFDRFVVGGFTCAPEGAQSLSKRGEHEAVSCAAGGDDLLNDRNLPGSIASRRDNDDEGRTDRLLALPRQDRLAGKRVPPGQALGEVLAERSPSVSFDQDQPPGLEPAVIRGASGCLEHGFNRLGGRGWCAEL